MKKLTINVTFKKTLEKTTFHKIVLVSLKYAVEPGENSYQWFRGFKKNSSSKAHLRSTKVVQ